MREKELKHLSIVVNALNCVLSTQKLLQECAILTTIGFSTTSRIIHIISAMQQLLPSVKLRKHNRILSQRTTRLSLTLILFIDLFVLTFINFLSVIWRGWRHWWAHCWRLSIDCCCSCCCCCWWRHCWWAWPDARAPVWRAGCWQQCSITNWHAASVLSANCQQHSVSATASTCLSPYR